MQTKSKNQPAAEVEQDYEPIIYPEPTADFKVEMRMTGRDLARQILVSHRYNRTLSVSKKNQYVRDLRAGRWDWNAQPIIINGDELLNGKHRLTAVDESNCTVPLLFVTGIEPKAIRTMDTGRNRTFAQMLDIDGENAPDVLAPMVQLLAAFRAGAEFGGKALTTSELYEALQVEPQTRDYAPQYQRRLPGNISKGLLACCHYLFAEKDAEAAEAYCTGIVTGENLTREDPAYAVREWLNHADKTEVKTKTVGRLLVDNWNKTRRNEKAGKTIRFPKRCPIIE